MRDRTWVGTDGTRHPGGDMVGRLWDRALTDSVVVRRQENLNFVMGEIVAAVDGRPDAESLVDDMLSLGSVVRQDDGTVADPAAGPPRA
jgi:hypothetical protein